MSIAVRAAAPADLPTIARLIRALAAYERARPDEVPVNEAELGRHLFGPDPASEVLIGELDGRPQGFALFFRNFSTWQGRPGLYLEDLFVEEEARGAGLGRALLAAVARIAVERGCPRLDWTVLDWNTPAIEFYKALGADVMPDWRLTRLSGAALARLAGRS